MRIAYVSGPYRANDIEGVQDNIYKARKIAIELWKAGYAVICPHTNTANFPGGAGEEKHGTIEYIKGDYEIISIMRPNYDCIVMMPDWRTSEGARKELTAAINRGLIVYKWKEEKYKMLKNACLA